MGRLILCALLLLGIMNEAIAEEGTHSGNFVMVGCRAAGGAEPTRDYDVTFREGLCLGALSVLRELRALKICVARDIPNDQVRRVVVKYIDDQPARLNDSFIVLAAEALRVAWPCPQPAAR